MSPVDVYLQPQDEQVQRPDSQVQVSPHLHFPVEFVLAFLRTFSDLRFDFIVFDL